MRKFIRAEEFHDQEFGAAPSVYNQLLGWAINKKTEYMVNVVYDPTHPNPKYKGHKQGKGKNYATWFFSEQGVTAEGIFNRGLDAIVKARLDPDASIGYHLHDTTEEVYIILAGSISMTTINPDDDQEHTEILEVDDAHVVKLGQAHYGIAGANGVEFLSISFR